MPIFNAHVHEMRKDDELTKKWRTLPFPSDKDFFCIPYADVMGATLYDQFGHKIQGLGPKIEPVGDREYRFPFTFREK